MYPSLACFEPSGPQFFQSISTRLHREVEMEVGFWANRLRSSSGKVIKIACVDENITCVLRWRVLSPAALCSCYPFRHHCTASDTRTVRWSWRLVCGPI